MKKLLSPRGYLSWTQVSMWKNSKERYIRQYIHGAAGYTNSSMDFGSKTATALETGEQTDDDMINMLVNMLPKYDVRDKEMRAELMTKNGMVHLLGKPDTFNSKTFAFREYKTGTTKWTQKMAQGHKQLHHYAAMIYLKHKKVPPTVHLDWAQTEIENGEVKLTGKVQSFEVKITLSDILEYLAAVSKVACEIDKVYREEIKKLA